MKYILSLLLLAISISVMAQSDFDKSIDGKGEVVYKGEITISDLYKEPSFSWMKRGIENYTPDSSKVSFLKKHLSTYRILVLLGTWCEDSQNLVPKLCKTLMESSFPMSQYQMFGVDRDKKAKYVEHELYRVTLVPTIIVIKGNNEVGRIVESVKKDIETDLARIIEDDIERNKK